MQLLSLVDQTAPTGSGLMLVDPLLDVSPLPALINDIRRQPHQLKMLQLQYGSQHRDTKGIATMQDMQKEAEAMLKTRDSLAGHHRSVMVDDSDFDSLAALANTLQLFVICTSSEIDFNNFRALGVCSFAIASVDGNPDHAKVVKSRTSAGDTVGDFSALEG